MEYVLVALIVTMIVLLIIETGSYYHYRQERTKQEGLVEAYGQSYKEVVDQVGGVNAKFGSYDAAISSLIHDVTVLETIANIHTLAFQLNLSKIQDFKVPELTQNPQFLGDKNV